MLISELTADQPTNTVTCIAEHNILCIPANVKIADKLKSEVESMLRVFVYLSASRAEKTDLGGEKAGKRERKKKKRRNSPKYIY